MKHTIRLNIGILFIATILLALNSFAQVDIGDSIHTKQLLPLVDSLRVPLTPIPHVGSIERSPTYLITDSMMNFYDYRYVGDFLATVPGIFIRDLGSPGQLHGITINGLDARNIAFMSDGILLNEPFTGTFDPYLYPTENIERVEIITGPRAFLYGLNSTGMAVNFVSKSKRAIHSKTRIRYQEAPYGQGFIDGMFSQDIIRGFNLTAGASHYTYDGRFENSNYDAWNARAKLRYNISNSLNLFTSGMYNQTLLGLNGGVDIATTPDSLRYDRLLATLVNTDAHEKVTRYDFQIGAAGRFVNDSTAITSLTLFHSTNFREYRDNESNLNAVIKEDTRSQWYGAKLTQNFMVGDNPIDLGAEVQSRGVIASGVVGQQLNTSSSIYGQTKIYLSPSVIVEPFARYETYHINQHSFSYGTIVAVNPLSWLEIFGGFSSSNRYPSFVEIYIDSVLSRGGSFPEEHYHIELGTRVFNYNFGSYSLKYFYRDIHYPLQLVPDDLDDIQDDWTTHAQEFHSGINHTISLHIGSFFVEGVAQYIKITERRNELGYYPHWSGTGGIYFWNKLFNNHLDLKTGLRAKAFSSYYAIEYNAQAQLFVPSSGKDIPSSTVLDFVLIAHLGNAYVHFILENLMDKQYITTSFYPMNERNLRFGLSWDFLD